MQTPEEILKGKDTSEFDKLPLNEKSERYASWYGIYNHPEWAKLKAAYQEGYKQRDKEIENKDQLLLDEINRLNVEIDRLKSVLNEF